MISFAAKELRCVLYVTARNAIVMILSTATAAIFYSISRSNKDPFYLTGDIPQGIPNFEPPQFSWRDENSTLNTTFSAGDNIKVGILLRPLYLCRIG